MYVVPTNKHLKHLFILVLKKLFIWKFIYFTYNLRETVKFWDNLNLTSQFLPISLDKT